MVLEETLESPLDCKEIKPIGTKEINPEYSLEGLMLKPKLQYLGHLTNSQLIGKYPDAEKDRRQEEKRTTEDEMVGCITNSMSMNFGKVWEMTGDRGAWHAAVHEVAKSWTQLSD